ncbi:SDR family NAD(P)-dependent oxidoreductase [Streptomyces hokutonensis]|uniref:SDR family NAD(P)-dependent oxidoreductase n=1 Tax=Streptomyces hokutonensis TaxID=1306990 RepID=UPI0036B7A156
MDLRGAGGLVFGATAEVGRTLAVRLHTRGARTALAGHDSDVPADVSVACADAPARIFDAWGLEACAKTVGCALAERGGLDGVVVRTGVAAFGAAGEVDDAVAEHVTALNALAPMPLLHTAWDQVSEGGILAVVTGVVAETVPARPGDCAAVQATWASWLTALRPSQSRRRVAVPEISLVYVNTGLAPRAVVVKHRRCPGDFPPRRPRGDVLVARVIRPGAGAALEVVR